MGKRYCFGGKWRCGWYKNHKKWRTAGHFARCRRGRELVKAALDNPTMEKLLEVKVHIDGYRKAATDMGINVEAKLDELLPGWERVENLLGRLQCQ